MSLQIAAQHLSNQGRGPDDTLVHMSRNEVKSLNDLAMAHGGQLTINPQTGLPEAGFLSAILPMVAGAALGPAGFGIAESAMGAGLMVGAGSYLMNPKAGLMGALSAGLGGYGGFGLGQGLANLGTSEAGLTSGKAANEAVDAQMQQLQAARDKVIQDKLATGYNPASWNVGNFEEFNAGQQDWNKALPQPYTPAENAMNRANFMNEYQTTPGYVRESSLANPNAGTYTPLEAPASKIPSGFEAVKQGIGAVMDDPSKLKQVGGNSWTGLAQMGLAAAAPAVNLKSNGLAPLPATSGKQVVPHYRYTPGMATPTPAASATGVENTYFPGSRYEVLSDADAQQLYPGYPDYAKPATAANGGVMGYAGGGPVERMSNDATTGQNTMYPMANMTTSAFATPYQDPRSTNMMAAMAPSGGGTVDAMSGEPNMQGTRLATGGLSDAHYNLGGYSDGGRLLRGPGDGVSDSIPAVIGKKQPARLADGEFVVPARIVSELGNGSTEAGARKLYAMMDRIQASRKNTVGKGKVAKNNRADKYLPA